MDRHINYKAADKIIWILSVNCPCFIQICSKIDTGTHSQVNNYHGAFIFTAKCSVEFHYEKVLDLKCPITVRTKLTSCEDDFSHHWFDHLEQCSSYKGQHARGD